MTDCPQITFYQWISRILPLIAYLIPEILKTASSQVRQSSMTPFILSMKRMRVWEVRRREISMPLRLVLTKSKGSLIKSGKLAYSISRLSLNVSDAFSVWSQKYFCRLYFPGVIQQIPYYFFCKLYKNIIIQRLNRQRIAFH